MPDIFIVSTFVGLVIFLGAIIIGATWFMGHVAGDDDCAMRWLITCLGWAVSLAIFILYVNR